MNWPCSSGAMRAPGWSAWMVRVAWTGSVFGAATADANSPDVTAIAARSFFDMISPHMRGDVPVREPNASHEPARHACRVFLPGGAVRAREPRFFAVDHPQMECTD